MKGFILSASLLFALSTSAFAEDSCTGAQCLPKSVKDSCTVQTVGGCIDWEQGIVYATGMGVPNDSMRSVAQKRYSAYQAARVVAQRNLLQMIEEVQIDSNQTVKMGMLENDEINVQVHGTLKQVSEVGKPKVAGDGSTWVTMKMYLRDIRSILEQNKQFESVEAESSHKKDVAKSAAPKASGDANTVYTGLIIDAHRSGVKPAMSPKVFGPAGDEVYGSFKIEREFALEFGVAGYVKTLAQAESNERVKGHPLVIKGKKASGAKGSDVKISQEDAQLIKQLERSQAFLREGRVVIVL